MNVFNVSNNHLSGRIPEGLDNPAYKESFVGNAMLCGGRNVMLLSCSSSSKMSSLFIVTMLILSCIYFCRSSKPGKAEAQWCKKTPLHSTEAEEAYIFGNLRENNTIGSRGAGKSHEVSLHNGQAVAFEKFPKVSVGF